MIKLIVPEEAYLQLYREAYDEYLAHKVTTYSFTDPSSCDIFAKFRRYREERDLPPNRVGEDKYWLVDDEKQYFIGEIAIRHRLNDALAQRGGHIGYGVRYAEWNRGYGTKMLALALEKAKGMRISPVLITCNDDNLASARVMEKNGFVLGDTIPVSIDGADYLTRRYWKTIPQSGKQEDTMERLLFLDGKNYTDDLPELVRTAVRGIIFVDGKLLLIEDSKNEVKLPGGGQEEGETDLETLLREVREETGCRVIAETVRPFGYIEEKRKSVKEDMIFHQFSRLYFCDVSDERGDTAYSENEKSRGMRVRTYTVEEAIAKNQAMLNSIGKLAWNQREYRTLLLIRAYLEKDNRGSTKTARRVEDL